MINLSPAARVLPMANAFVERVRSVPRTNSIPEVPSRVLFQDANAIARTETTAKLARMGFEWQNVAVTVTHDAVYIRNAAPFYAFNPYGEHELDQKISKMKILRRSTEETPHGTALRIRFRDEQRDVREIELVPSDRSRFVRALVVGVE